MSKKELAEIRRYLGKTQLQMAQLLGTSLKAVQSFEQGWRDIPVQVERQALLLRALKGAVAGKKRSCWLVRNCPEELRENCPTWEFHAGLLCWFINGTICHGEVQESWRKKMEVCRTCEVFQSMFAPPVRKTRKR